MESSTFKDSFSVSLRNLAMANNGKNKGRGKHKKLNILGTNGDFSNFHNFWILSIGWIYKNSRHKLNIFR